LLYLVENGHIGIATTSPTNILTIGQGMGNAIADGWDVYSSREYKTDITYLEETDYENILEEIEGIELARYRWKNSQDPRACLSTTSPDEGVESQCAPLDMLGVIVEDEGTPQEILSRNGKSISLYDYTSYALAGVKALNEKVKILDEFLTVKQDENGNLIEIDPLEGLRNRLAELGLVIDEEGTLIVEKIKAKAVETEELQVKASDVAKTGITLYDRSNSQPYCFYVENGVSMTVAGQCETAVTPLPLDMGTSAESGAGTGAETTIETELTPETNGQTGDLTEPALEETSAGEPAPDEETSISSIVETENIIEKIAEETLIEEAVSAEEPVELVEEPVEEVVEEDLAVEEAPAE